jgi:hypothetical protein
VALAIAAHRIAHAGANLSAAERERGLRELFGTVAGMVHLSHDTLEWTLYWPSSIYPVLLCSVQRLPAVCNLAAQADAQVLHLAASPGDVVVGLSAPVPLHRGGLAAGDGGAAFLEDLEREPVDRGALPAGIIVEIR